MMGDLRNPPELAAVVVAGAAPMGRVILLAEYRGRRAPRRCPWCVPAICAARWWGWCLPEKG